MSRLARLPITGAMLLALASPALLSPAAAQPVPPPADAVVDAEGRVFGNAPYDPRPEWKGPAMPAMPQAMPQAIPPMPARVQVPAQMPGAPYAGQPAGYDRPGYDDAAWQQARADWLAECRRNHRGRDGKTLGAVLGGVLGGVVGNRVAGRGNRTVGTVAGAAVGAVAGGAIGNGSDNRRARDYCETYLDRYTSQPQGYGYGAPSYAPAYGYAYQPVMVMMPVMVAAQPSAPPRKCVETVVTEEWVPVATPRRPVHHIIRHVPDKRVRITPDKRQRAN